MQDNFRKVTKEEYTDFIKSYPNKLDWDVSGISEPPMGFYNDFSGGKVWPESMIAKVKLYDKEEDREYFIQDLKENIKEVSRKEFNKLLYGDFQSLDNFIGKMHLPEVGSIEDMPDFRHEYYQGVIDGICKHFPQPQEEIEEIFKFCKSYDWTIAILIRCRQTNLNWRDVYRLLFIH